MKEAGNFLSTYHEEILKCTYCGFCQATCPVFSVTLRPAYNTRGKMLLLKEIMEGHIKLTHDLADTFFTCTTCQACTYTCPRGIKAAGIVVELRRELWSKGLAPSELMGLQDSISRTGNVFSAGKEERTRVYPSSVKGRLPNGNNPKTLIFTGCLPSYLDMKIVPNFMKILEAAKVDFTTLGAEETCCGLPLYLAGFDEFKPHALKLMGKMEAMGASELVTPCAGCYRTFSTLYPEIGNLHMTIYHTVEYLNKLVREQKLVLERGKERTVTYHDPCDLGRACNIFEEPRNLLKSIPGIRLVEMARNRSNARCCGGGGNLPLHHPDLALEIAAKRVRDALTVGADIIVTGCAACKDNLRKGARLIPREERRKIKTVDITQVVHDAIC